MSHTPQHFVTVRVPVLGCSPLPWYAFVVGPPVVAEVRKPRRKLVGWDAILKVSAEHGGPGSESRLRNLCRQRGAPVKVWRGMAAVADEEQFILWLEMLRVPIGLEPVGANGKAWRRGKRERNKGAKKTPTDAT